ncbi:MAG: UbiA family prenyltransferase [Pseudomonadota bacterium]
MSKSIPLVVDLDGTLIKSDLLVESALGFIRKNVLHIFLMVSWLISGKAVLKSRLAERFAIDESTLPYFQDVIELIKKAKAEKRVIVLATASHKIYANRIADFLGLFDKVFSTCETTNLTAKNKQEKLVAEFGYQGFDYVGNSNDDLVVWASARHAYVANPDSGVLKKANKVGNVSAVLLSKKNNLKIWFKALRLHQWIKNLLIFVPLIAAHKIGDFQLLLQGLIAFVLFGICASSVYLLNDLLDISDDRHHSTKKNRAFASGSISIISGLLVFPLLLILAFVGAVTLLPLEFSIVLGIYYVLTILYSFTLKQLMVVDVIALASLYTIRIIAGVFAFNINLTFWMLAFSMFIFLSLALVKRFAELHEARLEGKTTKTRGRGYFPDDLEMISSLGASSGYLAVMVLALYIQDLSTITMYAHPKFIWLACPLLLFWVSRTWMLAHRGQMHDDPVVFAIKDRTSIFVGILFGLIFWLAA